MIMDKKAQSPLTVVFVLIVFVIFWIFFFGSFLSTWGADMVAHNGMGGFEAFIMMNLNLVIGMALLIFVVWASIAGVRS